MEFVLVGATLGFFVIIAILAGMIDKLYEISKTLTNISKALEDLHHELDWSRPRSMAENIINEIRHVEKAVRNSN